MSREESEKFMADVYLCKNETGAADTDIEDLYNRVLPTTKQAKCLNLCVFKKLDIVSYCTYIALCNSGNRALNVKPALKWNDESAVLVFVILKNEFNEISNFR